jgi:hypothetical protein
MVTQTPASVAAPRSTLWKPTPCRAMIFSRGELAIFSRSKTSPRTITP